MRPTLDVAQAWHRLADQAPALCNGLRKTLAQFDLTPDIAALNRAARCRSICNARGQPIQFIEQHAPCGQREYERHIFEHGHVLTRAGRWHDIFNALIWLTYPKIKAELNAVHARQPVQQQRTAASDAATVFDESGAVLIGPDPRLAMWLKAHDWQCAFVTHRHLWKTHQLLIIGHAVLEKLANPYPGMIAKVIYQPWQDVMTLHEPPTGLDACVAEHWQQDVFTRPADLFPVPVLGVPGADPANEHPSYYDNVTVFRPARHRSPTSTTPHKGK